MVIVKPRPTTRHRFRWLTIASVAGRSSGVGAGARLRGLAGQDIVLSGALVPAGRTGAEHIEGMFRGAHHPVSSIDAVSNVSMNTTSLWGRRLASRKLSPV